MPTTLQRLPTLSYSSDASASFSSLSSAPPTGSLQTTAHIAASPNAIRGGKDNGGGGDLKLGLGLGIGMGLPLMGFMGLGCFLLWRLLIKQCPSEIFITPVTADSEKEQQHFSDSDDGYAAAAISRELMATEPKSLGLREILSTELYEAEGASRRMRPVELGN